MSRSWNARLAAVALVLALLLPAASSMAAAKKYQVTGKVLEVDDKVIVVQKADDEKWEIERSAATKVEGDLKVGNKVTIYYHMVDDSTENKDPKKK